MRLALHRQQMKSAMLPIAMIGGAVFYRWMGYLSFLSPYLIFMMLFITYCKLDPCDFRPGKGAPPPSCRADGTCRSCLPADIAL